MVKPSEENEENSTVFTMYNCTFYVCTYLNGPNEERVNVIFLSFFLVIFFFFWQTAILIYIRATDRLIILKVYVVLSH